MLTWEGGGWAHKYDVYLGTNENNLTLVASDVITGTLGSDGLGELSGFRVAEWRYVLLARRRQDDGESDGNGTDVAVHCFRNCADAYADSCTHSNTDAHFNTNADADADSNSYTDTNSHAYTDTSAAANSSAEVVLYAGQAPVKVGCVVHCFRPNRRRRHSSPTRRRRRAENHHAIR